MAITQYSELKDAVANWLDRDNLTAYVPDFISLYEAKFNRTMRLRQMETVATLTDAGGSYDLPADIAQIRDVWAVASPIRPLEPVTSEYAARLDAQNGPAAFYYVTGTKLYAALSDGADIGVRYFAKLPSMSADADANWLLSAYPDAYLYGSLVEAFMFQMDESRAQIWQQRLNLIHDEMLKNDAGMRWNHAQVRAIGPTP